MADLKRFALIVLLGVATCVGLSSFWAGRYSVDSISALADTVRITDSVIVVRDSVVTRWKSRVDTVHARSDSLDALVTIVNDSTVAIPNYGDSLVRFRPDSIQIPPMVIENLRSLRMTVAVQDTLILSLYQRDTTQQWRIATRDKLIAELGKQAHPKCGRRCGFVLGLATTAGLVYLVK